MKTNDQSAAVLKVKPSPQKPRRTRPVHINRDFVDLLEAILEASGTNLTVGEYVAKSLTQELAESLLPKRCWCGVQDIIANEYVLEREDIPNMNAAAQRWALENPEAAARIKALDSNQS